MRIPVWLLTVMATAILFLEGWTLNEVVQQGKDIAAIKSALKFETVELSKK